MEAARLSSGENGVPSFDCEKCVHCGACLWNCATASPENPERMNIAFRAGTGLVDNWNCWIGANFGAYGSPLSGPFYYGNTGTPPLNVGRIKKPSDAMLYMDTVTHYVYSPVHSTYRFTRDLDGDGRPDTMAQYNTAYNYGRPTVHS